MAMQVFKDAENTKDIKLKCSNLKFTSLDLQYIVNFTWLVELDLHSNEITDIPVLPPKLENLNLSYNKITKIENIPETIKNLIISNNKIERLENIPIFCEELDAHKNCITYVNVTENRDLMKIDISFNNLQTMPYLNNIQDVDIAHNKLVELPDLKLSSIRILYVQDNSITKLDQLPEYLEQLNASNNEIVKINYKLPNTITECDLSDNCLSVIPDIPNCCNTFNLTNNWITKIDPFIELPECLEILDLTNNNIEVDLFDFIDPRIEIDAPKQEYKKSVTPVKFTPKVNFMINPNKVILNGKIVV